MNGSGATIELVTTEALGDTSYLLVSGDEAALVDPQRDSWGLIESCTGRGVRIRYVLETHVHNDYVSGALEVRAATGATVAAPARAPYAFDHLAMAEDDEISFGDVTVRAMETPGHTAEHTAYLVFDGAQQAPSAVFTGGSLLVGNAGRTDLSGSHRTEELAGPSTGPCGGSRCCRTPPGSCRRTERGVPAQPARSRGSGPPPWAPSGAPTPC
ncbi:MBL fold metallo-hydrolase [Streptomyces sp. MS1.HAVA.3]|uniref:MBL fold metallo-hydrolase n=1 Tax=Streptomyces caledonius TaxID=3134107 RepID=A0ABU8U169_9ACTN